MSVRRKEDKFESGLIAGDLYSGNVVSNQICDYVKRVIKAKNMQPVTLRIYRAPQGERKKHWCFLNIIGMQTCLCILKQTLRTLYA